MREINTPLTDERRDLVARYYPVALKVCHAEARRLRMDPDDVVSAGAAVLLGLARRYDPARGPSFAGFLHRFYARPLRAVLGRLARSRRRAAPLSGLGDSLPDRAARPPGWRLDVPVWVAAVRRHVTAEEWRLLWEHHAEGRPFEDLTAEVGGKDVRWPARRAVLRLRELLPRLCEEIDPGRTV